jgi:predicted Fe-Mo cluster-binding NifX family protein
MGRRIYDDLRSVNNEAFIVQETSVEDAINLYLKNELKDNPEADCEH